MPVRERFRAAARRPVDAPVSIRTPDGSTGRQAHLVNLSLQGACLEIKEALVPGVDVTLEIRTPTLWDPLQLSGHVAWAQWNAGIGVARVGIRFSHTQASSLFSLFELLSSQVFDD